MTEARSEAKAGEVGGVERPTKRHYFPALDGLRAVAFLMVFLLHYLGQLWGWVGVDVFFVLSGFLITGILFDSRERPHKVRDFYIRRTLRIFPLYYGVFAVLLLLDPIFRWRWNWIWLMWPAYVGNFALYLRPALGVQNSLPAYVGQILSRTHPWLRLDIGHFWSLCVEEQFYLLWPWVVFSIKSRRKLVGVCLAVIAVVPLARVFAFYTLPSYAVMRDATSFSTPFRVDALMFGALIALLRRGPDPEKLYRAAQLAIGPLGLLSAVWIYAGSHMTGPQSPWRQSLKLSLVGALAACVILLALETGSLTYRCLNHRPLLWLGRISYGAYVFHALLEPLFNEVLRPLFKKPAMPVAVIALACTLLISWASFRWFESPFISLKQRWTHT